MATIRDYHRPASIEDGIALLARPGTVSVVIGGGTVVNARPDADPIDVVDLQALDLSGIESVDGMVRIGATTVLQDLVDGEVVPPLVRQAARREAPNTIRNVATVGGTVASRGADSGLLAALLVHDAEVESTGASGATSRPLPELLSGGHDLTHCIITAVTIAGEGATAWAGTGRTPADAPIVAAYARTQGDRVRLALTGVAASPVLIDPADVASLEPPGDFRGSSHYRKAMAEVLTARVLESLEVRR